MSRPSVVLLAVVASVLALAVMRMRLAPGRAGERGGPTSINPVVKIARTVNTGSASVQAGNAARRGPARRGGVRVRTLTGPPTVRYTARTARRRAGGHSQPPATSGAAGRRAGILLGVPLLLAAAVLVSPPAAAAVGPEEPAAVPAGTADLAVADLERRIQGAQDRLAVLQVQVALAVEAYDAVQVALSAAERDQQAAEAALATAVAAADTARDELGRWAAAAYRSGGPMAAWSAVLSADGARDLLHRSAAIRFVGQARAAALTSATTQEQLLTEAQQRIEAALVRVRAEAAAAEAARATVESRLADQQAEADALAAERTRLLRELATARGSDLPAEQRLLAARDADRARSAVDWVFSHGMPQPDLVRPRGSDSGARDAVQFALDQVGKPYEWGAAGPDAFDCSGLTMLAWQHGGVDLDHWSVGQARQAPPVPLADARPGDLVVYAADPADLATVYHVGLYLGAGLMVEAPHPGADVRVAGIWRPDLLGTFRP